MKQFAFFAVFTFFLCACQAPITQIDTNKLGKVFDVKQQQFLTPQQFVTKIATQPHILLGENHDSREQHQAEYWLLTQLSKQREQGSLLLEMLRVDQQPLVDSTSRQPIQSESDLQQQLQWQSSWNWDFYGALVRSTLQSNSALIATNLTKAEINLIMQGAEPLNGVYSTKQNIQQQIAELISNNHPDAAQHPDLLNKMVQVQQFRDRRMAEKLRDAPKPALLIAGNHHVNQLVGVPLHWRDLGQQSPLCVVMMTENLEQINPQSADYIWVISH